jgi:hypothetical protein
MPTALDNGRRSPRKLLRAVVVEAWLTRAHKRVAKVWLAERAPEGTEAGTGGALG